MNCHGDFVWKGNDAFGVPLGHENANPAGVTAAQCAATAGVGM